MERANTKVNRVGATTGLKEALRSGREAVKMLDAVIGQRFADDPTVLAVWRAARRVKAKPGAVRTPADVTGPVAVTAA